MSLPYFRDEDDPWYDYANDISLGAVQQGNSTKFQLILLTSLSYCHHNIS